MNQTWRLLIGDVRQQLRTLAAGSAQCVVTSPPYFGLRDYGTAQWAGGDPGCQHRGRVKPRGHEEKSRDRWDRVLVG